MRRWTVRLSNLARDDLEHIIGWTLEHFGVEQSIVYAETIRGALDALGEGLSVTDARARDEIIKGLRCLHAARGRLNGRHFIMFRVAPRGVGDVVEVLRLLHDSMDLARHLDATHPKP